MMVHVTTPDVARRLRRLDEGTSTAIVTFTDNLLIGPCTREIAQLAEARRRYWSGVSSAPRNLRSMYTRLVESLGAASEVVVWSSGSLQHAALLWMISALLADRPACTVKVIRCQQVRASPDDQFACIERELRAAEVRELVGAGEKLGTGARRAHAGNWRAFTAPLATAFNDRCTGAAEELERAGRYHAAFFPRRKGDALQLSRVDELLLTCVGGEWSPPSAILLRRSPEGMALRSWLACTGDVFTARRIKQWAEHSPEAPAVESTLTDGDHLLTGVRYRLSNRGRALLDEGVSSITEAPMCPIGGAAAYDPQAPVAAQESGEWRLGRL